MNNINEELTVWLWWNAYEIGDYFTGNDLSKSLGNGMYKITGLKRLGKNEYYYSFIKA
jgi:hypothetical protein